MPKPSDRILEILQEDEEIRNLFYTAFKWEGRPFMVSETMTKIRRMLYEYYNIEIEQYT
jgi:hypothetical protein